MVYAVVINVCIFEIVIVDEKGTNKTDDWACFHYCIIACSIFFR